MKDKRPENRSFYSSLFFSQLVVFVFSSSSHSLIYVFLFSIHPLTFYSSTFYSSSTLFFFLSLYFFTTFREKLLHIVLYWEINNTHSKYWVNPILKNIVNPIQYQIRIARPSGDVTWLHAM